MSGSVHEGLVEHAVIDKAFHALLEAVDGAGDVAGTFQVLAERVRHHMGGEDLDIARFADADPEEAKALLDEHLAIRNALDTLAAQAATGPLSARDVHAFKLRFSLHEAREETGLYRWTSGSVVARVLGRAAAHEPRD